MGPRTEISDGVGPSATSFQVVRPEWDDQVLVEGIARMRFREYRTS